MVSLRYIDCNKDALQRSRDKGSQQLSNWKHLSGFWHVKGFFAHLFHKIHENLWRIFLTRKWTIFMQKNALFPPLVVSATTYIINTIKKLCPALQKKRSDCGPSANFRDVDFQILIWYNKNLIAKRKEDFRRIFSNHSKKKCKYSCHILTSCLLQFDCRATSFSSFCSWSSRFSFLFRPKNHFILLKWNNKIQSKQAKPKLKYSWRFQNVFKMWIILFFLFCQRQCNKFQHMVLLTF